MRQNPGAIQKTAGVTAAILVFLVLAMPVQSMLSSLLRNEASLESQRRAIEALTARLSDNYAALQEAGQWSQIADEMADAETTAQVLQTKCDAIADILAGDLTERACTSTQIGLSGGITLHQSQSAYSGDSQDLLTALDQLSALGYPMTEMRITASPTEQRTTLTISVAGVSVASEEPQP